MKLTVLGKYGPYPAAGGACSGYLVQDKDVNVLLDCGNGVLSRLQYLCSLTDLDAIVLSHLHSDHISDIMVLKYALDILAVKMQRKDVPLLVYLPDSPQDDFNRISYKNVFSLNPIKQNNNISVKSLEISFAEMDHPVLSYAVKVSNNKKRLVYTGDTRFNENLIEFSLNADLLIADAGLLERDKTESANHMTAAEVGIIASKASVSKLLLTHIWPGYDEHELFIETLLYYPNAVIAQEMSTYIV